MTAKGIEQLHLFLLYQSVVLSVTDYGLGLTTMVQTNLLKLDRVRNEATHSCALAHARNASVNIFTFKKKNFII